MATYGDIRLALTKQVPGLDPEVLNSFILDTYQEILDQMAWQRLKQSFVIQTAAEVNGGTITATLGNQLIVADAAAAPLWNKGLNGRIIRVSAASETYQFTFQSAAADLSSAIGLLDRPYEASGGNDDGPEGALLSYQINQNVYPLPANVRYVEAVRNLDEGWPLTRMTPAELNQSEAQRGDYGDPAYWSPTFDQQSNPPVAQIEIYPIPQTVEALDVDVVAEDMSFGNGSASVMQMFMRPACLKAGSRALAEADREKWEAAEFWAGRYKMLLTQMIGIESQRIGPQTIRMAGQYSRHRILRAVNLTPQIRLLP